MRARFITLAALGAVFALALGAPAEAHDRWRPHGWHNEDWRPHHWRNDWRPHRGYPPQGYAWGRPRYHHYAPAPPVHHSRPGAGFWFRVD